jgi:hypothetical protein
MPDFDFVANCLLWRNSRAEGDHPNAASGPKGKDFFVINLISQQSLPNI